MSSSETSSKLSKNPYEIAVPVLAALARGGSSKRHGGTFATLSVCACDECWKLQMNMRTERLSTRRIAESTTTPPSDGSNTSSGKQS